MPLLAAVGLGVCWYLQSVEEAHRRLTELSEKKSQAVMESAKRRSAEYEEKRFREMVNEFALAWNDWASEYTERGTFNAKKAARASELFRRIEHSGAWVKKGK